MYNTLIYIKDFNKEKNEFMKSSKDVIDVIKKYKVKINSETHTEVFLTSINKLLDETLDEISKEVFPDLNGKENKNYRYIIRISCLNLTISIQKLILKGGNFYLAKENYGQYIKYIPLLDIEKYSNINGYNIETVRQWIRRGRLNSFKKINGKWMISILSELQKNIHKKIKTEFAWLYKLPNVYKDYEFMNEYTNIIFNHSRTQKDIYEYQFYNRDNSNSKKIIFNTKSESEKFELYLRGNQMIINDDELIKIYDKKI